VGSVLGDLRLGLEVSIRDCGAYRLRRSPCWLRLGTALFGLSAALWASPGWGQGSTGALTASDFALLLQRQEGNSWLDLSATDAVTYPNQARCQCAFPVRVLVQMASASRSKLSSLTATGTTARIYVGNDCVQLNTAVIPPRPQCDGSQLGPTLNGLSTLSANGSWAVETTVAQLFSAAGVDCDQTLATTIWLWIDSTGAGYPDAGVTGSLAPRLGIPLDGTPPEALSGITVERGDEALVVSWTSPNVVDTPDLAGYLVFCMRGDGLQVFNPSYYGGQYLTGQILCPATAPTEPTASAHPSAAGNTTALEVEAPSSFQNLDPNYLCSGLLPATQTSVRLGTLQNGILYTVGVAAVDNSGNASPIRSGFVQAPTATGGPAAGLGKSECGCRLAGVDRGAVPWAAMLAFGVASRLRRRGKRQRRSS
jgi:hypothetical protein